MDKKILKPGFFAAKYHKLKKKLPELLLQSLLITLGVVIALAIGNWDEDRKRDREVVAILENLKSEALSNIMVVQVWEDYLDQLKTGIDSVFNGQKSMGEVLTNEGIVLENLIQAEKPSSSLQETAWKTAQTTNLVQYFDYRIIYQLTDMYNYQNTVIQVDYATLNSLLLDRASFTPDSAQTNLRMMKKLSEELKVHHEKILMSYRKIFNDIEVSLKGME